MEAKINFFIGISKASPVISMQSLEVARDPFVPNIVSISSGAGNQTKTNFALVLIGNVIIFKSPPSSSVPSSNDFFLRGGHTILGTDPS